MEAIAMLLFVMALVQAVIALLLQGPKALALPVAQLVRPKPKNAATQAVVYTVAVALAGVLAFSVFQLFQEGDMDRIDRRDTRGDVLATIDKLRAQVLCALSAINLLLLFLLRSLAESMGLYNSSLMNLDAMKRQVKGLQTEYERVVTAGSSAKPAGAGGALDVQKRIEILEKENARLITAAAEADKLLKSADIKAQAMESQWKGFEREYDRVLAESQVLQKRLEIAGLGGGGSSATRASGGYLDKKDT